MTNKMILLKVNIIDSHRSQVYYVTGFRTQLEITSLIIKCIITQEATDFYTIFHIYIAIQDIQFARSSMDSFHSFSTVSQVSILLTLWWQCPNEALLCCKIDKMLPNPWLISIWSCVTIPSKCNSLFSHLMNRQAPKDVWQACETSHSKRILIIYWYWHWRLPLCAWKPPFVKSGHIVNYLLGIVQDYLRLSSCYYQLVTGYDNHIPYTERRL